MKLLLSVIIPCYNNGDYLVKMIDCFRQQTSDDWELIIVDDGSTDDTPIVIKECIKDFPNVQYLIRDREPKGSVVCRNIGFKQSNGKYVCHLDADDLVSNTFVEHRVAFMEAHPDIDYASFPAKAFVDENNLPSFSTEARTWGVGDENVDLLAGFLGAEYPFSVWNNIYRKDKVIDIVWDEKVKIYTDFSYIIPCILKGLKHSFSGLEEVDYYYRITPGNNVAMTSNLVSQNKCESTIYLFQKTIKGLKENGLFEQYKKFFFDFILIHLERLLIGTTKDNVDAFIDMCSKHYHCQIRMHIISSISRLTKTHGKHVLIRLGYAFLFGKFSYMKIFF